jgi:hypothetical protein
MTTPPPQEELPLQGEHRDSPFRDGWAPREHTISRPENPWALPPPLWCSEGPTEGKRVGTFHTSPRPIRGHTPVESPASKAYFRSMTTYTRPLGQENPSPIPCGQGKEKLGKRREISTPSPWLPCLPMAGILRPSDPQGIGDDEGTTTRRGETKRERRRAPGSAGALEEIWRSSKTVVLGSVRPLPALHTRSRRVSAIHDWKPVLDSLLGRAVFSHCLCSEEARGWAETRQRRPPRES